MPIPPRGFLIKGGILILLAVVAGCDEPLYHASKTWEKTWDVGPSPEVVADLRGGPIYVTPSSGGKVTAWLRIARVSKTSQQVADEAVSKAPGASLTQEGGSIKIMELDGNAATCSLHLFVPTGTRLDLHAGGGDLWIGYNPNDGKSAPVAPAKINAKSSGYLGVNIVHNAVERPVLDLEGLNLTLIVDGVQVDVGPPTDHKLPGGGHHWRFNSK